MGAAAGGAPPARRTFPAVFDWLPWHFLAVCGGFALGLALILRLLRERRRPSVTFAWLMAMILLPYVGVPLFLLFYRRKFGGAPRSRVDEKPELYPRGIADVGDAAREARGAAAVETLLRAHQVTPPREGNRVALLMDGREAWERMLAVLRAAEHEILCQTFLIAADDVGRAFVAALAERARAGVRVRLLVDALGCFGRKGRFLDPLRAAGGEVGIFLPVLPVRRRWSANLRNHRKVLIADRRLALTGGRNVGEEYLGPSDEEQRWVDTTVEVEGPVVQDLLDVYAADWEFATHRALPPLPGDDDPRASRGEARLQVVESGPDVPGEPLSDAVLAAVAEAHDRIWMITPYYVPDEVLQRSLELQARMGRDVLLITPERSNHKLADIARERFVEELVEAGARVVLVPDRMVHAKAILFDDFLAVVGSANLDQRSLYLNFESSLFVTSRAELDAAERMFERLASGARVREPRPAGVVRRWTEDLSLLVSPLL